MNGGPVCIIGAVLAAACKPEPNARQPTLPAAKRLYSSPVAGRVVWSRESPIHSATTEFDNFFVSQAMAHHLPSCIVTMRVLKDICRRVPAWGVLDQWVCAPMSCCSA